MAKSNVQKFEVGDQVPANWFEASAPATVTYGGDFSFKFKADGGRYVTADLGTLLAVMSSVSIVRIDDDGRAGFYRNVRAKDGGMIIKQGSLLVIETGVYSEYCFTGPFRVLKDLDQVAVAERFRKEWRPGPDSWREVKDGPEVGDFVPWLSVNGFIEDVAHHSWHVGYYGEFKPEIQDEKPPAQESTEG